MTDVTPLSELNRAHNITVEDAQKVDRDEALAAVGTLRKLLKVFTFAIEPAGEERSLSVAIAALMTPVVRPILRSAPLFCFNAANPGVGKSLLADMVARIATGKATVVVGQQATPRQARQLLLSILLTKDCQVACFDDVQKTVGGALCSILTQEQWQDRILRKKEPVTIKNKVTFLATGNGMKLQGALKSRSLMCELGNNDPSNSLQPYFNMYNYIQQNREILVKAILTILNAYNNAGMPLQPISQFARFEEWSDWIRSPLVWLGLADPCSSQNII